MEGVRLLGISCAGKLGGVMKSAKLMHWLIAIFILLKCGFALGQSLDQAYLVLQSAIAAASEDSGLSSRNITREQIGRLRMHINRLQSSTLHLPIEDQNLYSKSLLHNANLIQLAMQNSGAADPTTMLTNVEEDLKLKTAVTDGFGVSSRFNGRVAVSVNTRRINDIIGGYIIVFNPLFYFDDKPFARFVNVSSPSKGYLPPGRYELIAFRERIEVCREVVTIGLAAEDAVNLDIQVP
jgi:hypothetical protein